MSKSSAKNEISENAKQFVLGKTIFVKQSLSEREILAPEKIDGERLKSILVMNLIERVPAECTRCNQFALKFDSQSNPSNMTHDLIATVRCKTGGCEMQRANILNEKPVTLQGSSASVTILDEMVINGAGGESRNLIPKKSRNSSLSKIDAGLRELDKSGHRSTDDLMAEWTRELINNGSAGSDALKKFGTAMTDITKRLSGDDYKEEVDRMKAVAALAKMQEGMAGFNQSKKARQPQKAKPESEPESEKINRDKPQIEPDIAW